MRQNREKIHLIAILRMFRTPTIIYPIDIKYKKLKYPHSFFMTIELIQKSPDCDYPLTFTLPRCGQPGFGHANPGVDR
jgi:hypothetical protein